MYIYGGLGTYSFGTVRHTTPFYVGYIDDIFGIWSGTEVDLLHFHNMANGIHPNIQLDLRFSKSSIVFLDVNISVEKGFLSTDLYSKPTDKHMYLNKKSSHTESTKKSIPFGLGIRARRICSTDDFSNNGRKLKLIYANLDILTTRSRISWWRWINSTARIYWTTEKITKSVTVFRLC